MFDNINRFEVIDETGRVYVNNYCKIEASLQDVGQTLKIFVENRNLVEETKASKWKIK